MPRIAGPGIGRDEIRRSRTAMGHWEQKWRGQHGHKVSLRTRTRTRQKRSKIQGINRFLGFVSWNERKESQVLILQRMFESVFKVESAEDMSAQLEVATVEEKRLDAEQKVEMGRWRTCSV